MLYLGIFGVALTHSMRHPQCFISRSALWFSGIVTFSSVLFVGMKKRAPLCRWWMQRMHAWGAKNRCYPSCHPLLTRPKLPPAPYTEKNANLFQKIHIIYAIILLKQSRVPRATKKYFPQKKWFKKKPTKLFFQCTFVAFAWQAVMQICCASSVAQFSSKLETRLPQRRYGASNKGQAQQQ